MAMDEKRQGEIALAIIKKLVREEIEAGKWNRKMTHVLLALKARKVASYQEAKDFSRIITDEMLKESKDPQ